MLGSPSTQSILLCPLEARAEALTLLYGQVDPSIRDLVIAEALSEASHGVIDFSGLWIAQRRGKIIGTLLTQMLASKAGAVWPPEVAEGWGRASTARQLLVTAIDHLEKSGCRIAQALVENTAPARMSADLKRGGMPKITELHYLSRDTNVRIPCPHVQTQFQWQSFGPETKNEFSRVMQATYCQSLDMPELEGIRSIDDIIAGHQATGRFEPSRWMLGTINNEPEAGAVILLSEIPDRDAWEVAYLGLTPSTRGRGLGYASLEYARSYAARYVSRLELAVDLRNHPAVQLYKTAGFQTYDRRKVHLAILGQGSQKSG